MYQLQKFFPKISACLRVKQFEKMHGCMVQNLQRGIESGLYREDVNIEFISRIYFTGLVGIKDNEIFPPAVFEINATTRLYLEYHIRGIATNKGLEILNTVIAKY
jgi:hypothetical protein